MIVISDTTPINYLILIDCIDLLSTLYGRVVIPQAVFNELQAESVPQEVKAWIAALPHWVEVHALLSPPDASLAHLDIGEQEAIALAKELDADLLIIDESEGRNEARRQGVRFIGTLRVLYDAAGLGLCDLPEAYNRLRQTSFRVSEKIMERFLALDAQRKAMDL